MVTLPKTVKNVQKLFPSSHAEEKCANRGYLLKVVQCLRLLAHQGSLALRGDDPEETNSNFMQLLHLHSLDDPLITQFLKKKTDKYCSHQIQNELLQVMANKITQKIACSIQSAKYYTVIVVCFRWVSDDFEPHKDFIGLFKVESIKAETVYLLY